MKALSLRQIKTCEESHTPRCRCRCQGALHGVRQNGYVQLLDKDDEAHRRPDVSPEAYAFVRGAMSEVLV